MSDEAVRKEFQRARQFAESNHAYLADVTIELLAKYGHAARSAAIQECADFISKFGRDKIDPAVAAKKLLCETLPNAVLALKER